MGKEIELENPRISEECAPDIHRGKAITATSLGIVVGGWFIALCLSVGTVIAITFGSLAYGVIEALLSL